jgi:uncharacterized protein YebE (UPF0316 family)
MTPALGGLMIFFLRVTDMSLDTLRMLFTVRGRKLVAGAIGVVQATVFVVAVSAVLAGPLTVWNVLGYSLGFGAGVVLGIWVEERMAVGYSLFRIYSPTFGPQIAQALRAGGYGATEFPAVGRDGCLTLVHSAVARKDTAAVHKLVSEIDRTAFVTVDEVHPLQHGHFRH